jgi:SOS regulatory protein LexA
MDQVTKRQAEVLFLIHEYVREKGYPPTVRELVSLTGRKSTAGIQKLLDALERKGHIKKAPGRSRGIVPRGAGQSVWVPLVGGVVAGAPVLSEKNIERYCALDESMAPKGSFLLRVQGDCMVGDHIRDGDLVLVMPQRSAEDGEIVVAMENNETMVKRFQRGVPLAEKPLSIRGDVQLSIIGKVVAVFRFLDSVHSITAAEDRRSFRAIQEHIEGRSNEADVHSKAARESVPVYLSANLIEEVDSRLADCAATANVMKRNPSKQIIEEILSQSILDQATESIVVCDEQGRIIRVSEVTYRYIKRRSLRLPFNDVFSLKIASERVRRPTWFSITDVLKGKIFQNEEVIFSKGCDIVYFLLSARPLMKHPGRVPGCIVTLTDITERRRAEEALRESNEKYRTLVEQSLEGIIIAQGVTPRLVFANPAIGQILNYTPDELMALSPEKIRCLIHPEDRTLLFQRFNDRLKGEPTPPRYEFRGVRKDGSVCWLEITSTRIVYRGKPAIQGTFVDITKRKKIEQELLESEERFRTIVEQAADAIIAHDLDGRILIVNSLACKYTGYSKEELLAMNASDIDDKIIEREYRKKHWEELRVGKYEKIETIHTRKNGSTYPAELLLVKIVFKGQPIILTFGRDITERKRMELTLRASEGKYRSLVESSDDSIYLVDRDCSYLFMNKKHLSRLGLKSNQVIGRSYSEFHAPEETKDFIQKVDKVIHTKKSLSYEYKSQRDNRYFIRTLSPLKSAGADNPDVITVISKDITALKRAENELREREAFNFALFQYNPVETVVVDLEGRVTGFNLAKENSGDRLPHIGALMYRDYAGKHTIDMHAELMDCIKSGKAKEFPGRRYGEKYLSITMSPFSKGALIISEDITDRKRAEESLQKERDTFFSVLQKAPYGVVLLDKDEESIFINGEFTRLTGYTIADVPTVKDWFRLAYPTKKYRVSVIKTWKKDFAQRTGEKIFHRRFHRSFFRTFKVTCKDGIIKDIEFRPTMLEDGSTIVMLADITERKRMHELLETAATEWHATFDAISDAVCLLDREGRIKRCNETMLKLFGKPFRSIANRNCWEVLQDVSKLPEGYPLALLQETRRSQSEVQLRDGRWFRMSIDPLLSEQGQWTGSVLTLSDINQRMLAEKELQDSREQLRNLTTYLQSVREQERTHIAREIHDELAQVLTALRMDVSWLNKRLPREQIPWLAKTKSMSKLIDNTIQTVKRISAELRPGVLDDLGLVAAIEWQAEEFQNRTGISCRVAIDPEDITVNQDCSTAVFRIFQETLTNVARHAHATKVTVDLKERAGMLTLKVTDNGKGITKKQISNPRSFGLIGMKERVHPWGGRVSIEGSSKKGTTVLVSLPYTKEQNNVQDVSKHVPFQLP